MGVIASFPPVREYKRDEVVLTKGDERTRRERKREGEKERGERTAVKVGTNGVREGGMGWERKEWDGRERGIRENESEGKKSDVKQGVGVGAEKRSW